MAVKQVLSIDPDIRASFGAAREGAKVSGFGQVMKYAAHMVLTTPARETNELWRLALGLVAASAVMFGLARGIVALVRMLAGPEGYMDFLAAIESAESPGGLLTLLVLMGAMGLATVMVCEVLHNRRGVSLFGPAPRFWQQFFRVSLALLAVNLIVVLLPPWPLRMASDAGLPPVQWLALLPVTLVALLIQTGSEEVFFRGYFQSQLAARLSHPGVWLVLPSLAFAWGHYAPEIYGGNATLVAFWALVFGVAAADLTARSGTLGPAIALHLVNNFMAMGVMSLSGEMSGLALLKLPFGPEDEPALAALLPVDLAMMGVSWLAARLALRV